MFLKVSVRKIDTDNTVYALQEYFVEDIDTNNLNYRECQETARNRIYIYLDTDVIDEDTEKAME